MKWQCAAWLYILEITASIWTLSNQYKLFSMSTLALCEVFESLHTSKLNQ